MPSGKVTSNSSTKSFGTQTAAKSTDSFSINASAIPVTTAKNVQEALERVTGQTASGPSAPGSPQEGDIWYDTDDDEFYVRDEDSWNEVVTSISGTVDGGSY